MNLQFMYWIVIFSLLKLASCRDERGAIPERVHELEKNLTILENQLAQYEDSAGLLENNITDTERSLDDLVDELDFEKSTTAKVEVQLDQTRNELKYTEDQMISFKKEMEKLIKTVKSSSEDSPLIAELKIELDNLQRKIMDELISAEPKLKVRVTEISSKLDGLYEKEKELESRIEIARMNLVEWQENLSVLHRKVNQTRKRISGTKKVRELEISLGKLETQLDELEHSEKSLVYANSFVNSEKKEWERNETSIRKVISESTEKKSEMIRELHKTTKKKRTVQKNIINLNETLKSSGQDSILRNKLGKELDGERRRMEELIDSERQLRGRLDKLSVDRRIMFETVINLGQIIVSANSDLVKLEEDLARCQRNISETRKRITVIQIEIEVARKEVEAATE